MSQRCFLASAAIFTFLACGLSTEAADTTEAGADSAGTGSSTTAGKGSASAGGSRVMTAGYDKSLFNPFFIRTSDEQFRLSIGLVSQPRFQANWRDAPPGEDDFTQGFSVNRTRLFFEGNYTPKFDYWFRVGIDDEGDFSLELAFLQYNFGKNKRWALRAGRQFVGIYREDWQFLENVQGVGYSANTLTFAIGSSNAVQVLFTGDRHRFWAAVGDGSYGSVPDFPDNVPSQVALTGRWEYQLSGRDWSVWNDLVGRRGRSRGILLGVGGGYQDSEATMADPTDTAGQLTADLSFNGNGFQAMIASIVTLRDQLVGDSFYNYGVLVQGGYFFTDQLQAFGEYNLIDPGDQPGTLEAFNSLGVGVHYFPFEWTNRWKFTAEIAHMFDTLDNTLVQPGEELGWLPSDRPGQTVVRVQAQIGF